MAAAAAVAAALTSVGGISQRVALQSQSTPALAAAVGGGTKPTTAAGAVKDQSEEKKKSKKKQKYVFIHSILFFSRCKHYFLAHATGPLACARSIQSTLLVSESVCLSEAFLFLSKQNRRFYSLSILSLVRRVARRQGFREVKKTFGFGSCEKKNCFFFFFFEKISDVPSHTDTKSLKSLAT